MRAKLSGEQRDRIDEVLELAAGVLVFLGGLFAEQVDAAVDCSRCLEPIERPTELFFDAIFVSSDMMPEDADTALTDSDLDESVADGGVIDVADALREQIMLDLPDHPVCREICKGLCPKCGGNRNLIDCKCEENEIDPRWAALKDLK